MTGGTGGVSNLTVPQTSRDLSQEVPGCLTAAARPLL